MKKTETDVRMKRIEKPMERKETGKGEVHAVLKGREYGIETQFFGNYTGTTPRVKMFDGLIREGKGVRISNY